MKLQWTFEVVPPKDNEEYTTKKLVSEFDGVRLEVFEEGACTEMHDGLCYRSSIAGHVFDEVFYDVFSAIEAIEKDVADNGVPATKAEVEKALKSLQAL